MILASQIISVVYRCMILFYDFFTNMCTLMQTRTNSARRCWRRWAGRKGKDLGLTSRALQNSPGCHIRATQLVTKIVYDFYIEIDRFTDMLKWNLIFFLKAWDTIKIVRCGLNIRRNLAISYSSSTAMKIKMLFKMKRLVSMDCLSSSSLSRVMLVYSKYCIILYFLQLYKYKIYIEIFRCIYNYVNIYICKQSSKL